MRYLTLCSLALLPLLGLAQRGNKNAAKQTPVLLNRDSLIGVAEVATSTGYWDLATEAYSKAIWMQDDKGTRLAMANVYLLQGDTAQYCTFVPTSGDDRLAEKLFYQAHCTREDSVSFAATGLDPAAFPRSAAVKTTWYRSGNKTHYKVYDVDAEVQVSLTISATDTVYGDLKDLPEFPEGETALFKFIGAIIRYPNIAQDSAVQGTVYITFVVGKDGAVENVKVLRGIHYSLDEESLRVVSNMPAWKPGMYMGEPVRTSYNLPMRFTLR